MASEQKPPNYRDIAEKAGVSVASVSLALRNDRRISPPVRDKIKRVAKELGYRPNPLLSAYQASVRSRQPATFRATLGWINDHPDQNAWRKPWTQPIRDGALARAQELGYELDEIWFPEIKVEAPKENVQKIQKILRAGDCRSDSSYSRAGAPRCPAMGWLQRGLHRGAPPASGVLNHPA